MTHTPEQLIEMLEALRPQESSPHYEQYFILNERNHDALILTLRQMCWQPIETAPKDGRWIIGSGYDGSVYRISWGRNQNNGLAWCSVAGSFIDEYITHWCLYPSHPPTEGEAE